MYLSYFDESGDDGYPKYSSELFVLTSLYLHYQEWKDNFSLIKNFRRKLKKDFGLPAKIEFHTKHFVLNKNPFKQYNITNDNRREILIRFSKFIPTTSIKFINVVINKNRIKDDSYLVLENALKYNIQRIENDLSDTPPRNHKFIVISDEGRIGKMRKITRKIQKLNIIPSKFLNSKPYRREIQLLIEDPIPKKSQESYFIQIADFVSYVIYTYSAHKILHRDLSKRVKKVLTLSDIKSMLDNLKPSLNLNASREDEYGIVCYPK